ncbi:MAG TPA: GMP/IMP nucleotidase [Porticoccaceae bacterium]|nr:GMP/IMP nucleotidase [Porticoccaceae bacterium]
MIPWSAIDTVLLDMDGTLLDLHFDNHFWQHHLPQRFAQLHKIEPEASSSALHERFEREQHRLNWYCTDYWSAQLELDVVALKREVQHLIAERPWAMAFLEALGHQGRQRILITNAHRDSLNLKLGRTRIGAGLDRLISSHDYGKPKEDPAFWIRLAEQIRFDPKRTLFIDDSEPVLAAARDYGIGHLLCVRQPDSKQPPREGLHFPALNCFSDLLPVR